jgi:hypothetical protein
MRSKSFRRKHGKMSRRRRAGNGLNLRQTTGEMISMEEGRVTQPAAATNPMNILGRSNTGDLVSMEEGTANPMNIIGRSNTGDLVAMEEGVANPHVAIDIESTPDIEMGVVESGGRRKRTRKARKGRKTRKGGKRRKSHRR